MAGRSRVFKGVPSPIYVYSQVLRRALQPAGIKQLLRLPSLSVQCSNIEIDPSHVSRYAAVCGFDIAGIQAPITYPFALTFPLQMLLLSDGSFPFPLLGLIHLTNRIEQFSPILPRSEVHATISLGDSLIQHEKGLCFTVTSELHSADSGKLVWRNESVMLRRSQNAHALELSQKTYESRIKDSDVSLLQEKEKWHLDSNFGRKYAFASGDYNPIHLFGLTAYMFGFKQGAIIHGMWTKARAIASIMNNVSPPLSTLSYQLGMSQAPAADIFVEFKTPLFLPGDVSLRTAKLEGTHACGIAAGKETGRDGAIFEVRNTSGDQQPHVRGICSWKI